MIQVNQEGIVVNNAGIVLLNSYIPMLFERVGIVVNTKFVSEEKQQDAVYYLQYLVTGSIQTEASYLTLNKVLCGYPISNPIKTELTISESDKNLIDSLIHAVIGHWSAIGECSTDGFRGNWLIRDGILREEEERWELTVEKKVYDVLLLKSPFSFSIIKFPWMQKPLHVTWSF